MYQFLSQKNQEESKKTEPQKRDKPEKVRFCQNCGSKLEERDLFCTECGNKVELEQENQSKEKTKATGISNDRMNAILTARNDLKSTFSEDVKELTKNKKCSTKELAISEGQKISQKDNRIGYYVSKDSTRTEYFVIESIDGNVVTGKICDSFKRNGFGNELFSGTINENKIEVNGIQRINANTNIHWDLHFSGTISDDTISGTWDRINGRSENMTYRKV